MNVYPLVNIQKAIEAMDHSKCRGFTQLHSMVLIFQFANCKRLPGRVATRIELISPRTEKSSHLARWS